MAHYFIFEDRLGYPFDGIREMKTVIAGGAERRQRTHRPKVMLVLDGECRVKTRMGLEATLKPGDLLIISKPCIHTYTSLSSGRDAQVYIFGIYFETASPPRTGLFAKEWKELYSVLFREDRHVRDGINDQIRSLIAEFREEEDKARIGSLNRLRALAIELVVEVARVLSQPPPSLPSPPPRSHALIVNEVKEYLGKTVGRKLTLSSIAFHFNLSEEHLARIFKKETGMTVMEYLRTCRVQAARTLLLSTTESITSLAIRVGFSSSNHFCRSFAKLMGQTPMAFRRTHGGFNDPAQLAKTIVKPRGMR